MAEYHTTYQRGEGETTQWEDLQRKFGNLPPKEPLEKPPIYAPAKDEAKDAEWLDGKDEDELEALVDEVGDDRFLEAYRKKRLAELQSTRGRIQYGSVMQISRTEFVQEVSAASERCWVVCHLYKDGLGTSAVLGLCLEELAFKYPATKFVKIVSTECIPSYPDQNLPTVLLYHNTQCVRTVAGLSAFGGLHTTPESVAGALNSVGPVCAALDDQQEEGGFRQPT